MGVRSTATARASRNRIGACTRGPASRANLAVSVYRGRLARLVGLTNGRVAANGSPGRTVDGRVVRDFKLELTAREF